MEKKVHSCDDLEDLSNSAFNLKDCSKTLPEINNEEETDEEEYSDAKDDCHEVSDEELDAEALTESQKNLSDVELERLRTESTALKNEGNECYKKSAFPEAIHLYTKALNTCPVKYSTDRSILFANRAAAKNSLDKKEQAILDCNKAIELNPNYLKAVLRRAQLLRKLDHLDKSLEDYKKVMELEPSNDEARYACATMPAEIAEKNEKLKQEMFSKLKDLGNLCLRPFGLSTDNFKVVQDPNSGGYSVNFQNNPSSAS